MVYPVDFVLPAGLSTFQTHFYRISNVPSQFAAQLDAVGRTEADITTITPKFASLSTVFQDEDLDFIRQVFIRVFDPSDPDNINREVFYLDPVPPNTRTIIRPFPGLADVKQIAALPVFGIEIGISLWELSPRTLDMRMTMELSANID